jgi:hypothetical protein
MRSGSLKLSIGALALAAGLAGAAIAQAPSAAPPEGGRHMVQLTPEQKQARLAEMRQKMAQHHAERAKLMHDALGITPNQEGAWKTFQDSMTPPTPPKPPAENLTTPQRLDEQLARVNERAAEAKKRIDATKRLYAALTPTQQKSFDALQKLRGGREGMRGERGHGGRGGHDGMRGGMHGPGGPDGFGGPPPG